ncbi:hypothetical protein ACVW00_003213 [Marmoricola sp. URHA0025 HA25]
MTSYAVLLPGDESTWATASAEQRAAMYDKHNRFAELLAERGHKVTGGAELTPSAGARTVSGSLDSITVTEGPYAETTEQLTGFYTVETDDLEDLLNVVGILAESGGRVEVRACVDHSG